jgi:mono/diheme cytochrome c family protein
VIKRIVTVTQVVALLSAVAFVVLLFANEPDNGASAKPSTPSASNASSASETTAGAPATPDGAAVFANRCASCHGSDGGGGLGPQLSGGRAAQRFPNIADQIGVIADGRGGMPAFGSRLSEAEIKAVAEYTRTL